MNTRRRSWLTSFTSELWTSSRGNKHLGDSPADLPAAQEIKTYQSQVFASQRCSRRTAIFCWLWFGDNIAQPPNFINERFDLPRRFERPQRCPKLFDLNGEHGLIEELDQLDRFLAVDVRVVEVSLDRGRYCLLDGINAAGRDFQCLLF